VCFWQKINAFVWHTIETTEVASVGHCQSKIVYRTSVVVYEQNSKRFLFEQIFLGKDCVYSEGYLAGFNEV
jgi:hypothetical protein